MLFTKLRRRGHDIPPAPESNTASQPNVAEGNTEVGPIPASEASPSAAPSVAPSASIAEEICESTCPACGHHVAIEFLDAGWHPLTTLAWPESSQKAKAMPKLPHHFVRCVDCGHIYNTDFDYGNVPYSDKPNLMYNRGEIWSQHLEAVKDLLVGSVPRDATIVEIGCGDGSLLRAIKADLPNARCVGFDPNSKIDSGYGSIEARSELFAPAAHLAEYRPDVIISRHVLEHLLNPLGFVQQLAFASSWFDSPTRLFIEVPCIDLVMSSGRTVDFFYEHNSHFTTESLKRMLSRCASGVELVETAYNGEVVYALAEFTRSAEQLQHARQALVFRDRAERAKKRLAAQLQALADSSPAVAIWGGTGKASAFINQNGLDAKRFPLVVDSDENKVGTYVPGAGQRILSPTILNDRYIDAILIATQWRASDIVLEIKRRGIRCERVLLEFDGRLVDYELDAHPYRVESADAADTVNPSGSPHRTGSGKGVAAPHVSIAGAGLPLVPNSSNPN